MLIQLVAKNHRVIVTSSCLFDAKVGRLPVLMSTMMGSKLGEETGIFPSRTP
jgi:hypothetical protein